MPPRGGAGAWGWHRWRPRSCLKDDRHTAFLRDPYIIHLNFNVGFPLLWWKKQPVSNGQHVSFTEPCSFLNERSPHKRMMHLPHYSSPLFLASRLDTSMMSNKIPCLVPTRPAPPPPPPEVSGCPRISKRSGAESLVFDQKAWPGQTQMSQSKPNQPKPTQTILDHLPSLNPNFAFRLRPVPGHARALQPVSGRPVVMHA